MKKIICAIFILLNIGLYAQKPNVIFILADDLGLFTRYA